MKILAIDPGFATGIATGDVKDGKVTNPNTLIVTGFTDTTFEIELLLMKFKPELVVIERFTITAATGKKDTKGSLQAIELIGVTRYLAGIWKVPLELQSPEDAKSFVTDDKLKKIGWYVSGPDHARDASRHLILAAVRHNVLDVKNLIL